MRVCVVGLWHLGIVTAACLSRQGHEVVGLDSQFETVRKLQEGIPPLLEPGIEDLIQQGLSAGRLSFATDSATALRGTEMVWITYDTPVDSQDRADSEYVIDQIVQILPYVPDRTLILISSQLPVGSVKRLEQLSRALDQSKAIRFAYSPENLRLGKAVAAFMEPDRVVVGARTLEDQNQISELLRPFNTRIEWMSVESAEMTKHALNAFLATSVAFANEIATLCEVAGADAKEVERGLKSEARVGPKAYLGPGAAFAGGTLARDIRFLVERSEREGLAAHLLKAVCVSNEFHKNWTRQKLEQSLGDLRGRVISVWGLTYKPGTSTLRRSGAVELCEWLCEQGSLLRIHDPAVSILPKELEIGCLLCPSALEAITGADLLFVATEWPDYARFSADELFSRLRRPVVIDPSRFLVQTVGTDPRFRYLTVGKGNA